MTTAQFESVPSHQWTGAAPPPPVVFRADSRVDGRADVLVLAGELCRVTRERLAHALRVAVDATRCELVVDVRAVTFVDAGSINELLAASAVLATRGNRLWLTGANPMFHRLLEIFDLVGLEQRDGRGGASVSGGEPGAGSDRGAQALGAALRRIVHERHVSRTEARAILERRVEQGDRSLHGVAIGVVDGTIPVATLPAPCDPYRQPRRMASTEIRRRRDREYVVLRVGERLDRAAAVALERSLMEGTDNADVVLDMRGCESGSADGLRVLLRLRDELAATRSTLTLREPPSTFVGSIHDVDLLGRFTVSHEPVPRARPSGGADPARR